MELITAIGSGILAYGVTRALVPPLITIAHRFNILDCPDSRLKNHKAPTAYLGGVAVYAGLLVSAIIFLPLDARAFFLIAGVTLLVFLGLIDDLQPQSPLFKICGQVIAALCFLRGGLDLKHEFLSHASLLPQIGGIGWSLISALWIATATNGFNLIDVMDGYAATNGIGAAILFFIAAFFAGHMDVCVLMAALCGALIAFLRFNAPPASIYLGDAGSLSIGGLLAVTPFMLAWGTRHPWGIITPALILFVPLCEVGMLMLIRSIKGIPFYQGSRHHAIHFLRDRGWDVRSILYLVSAFYATSIVPLAAVFLGFMGQASGICLSATIAIAWILLIYAPMMRDVAFVVLKSQKQREI